MEEVRISLTKYQGHQLIDLRVYFKPDGSEESNRPRRASLFPYACSLN